MSSASKITPEMAHELAVATKVCVRPLVRRVLDQETGDETKVALPCNSTREDVCPSCADKNRRLRMQQCKEGWHRTDEPEPRPPAEAELDDDLNELDDDLNELDDDDQAEDGDEDEGRRTRSTRRRDDAPDLPRVPCEDRTVGRTFTTPDGKVYQPSMFLTLTMPSYGKVKSNGAPLNPASYDYRRAALDALHFAKLVDRFWQNLRRCAGYKVQYFAAVEPQNRLAPHLHAAIRGAIPRAVLKKVIAATYKQLWWPRFDRAVYDRRVPAWTGDGYCDPDTGLMLPTWAEALDQAGEDREQRDTPAHVLRFGSRHDAQGLIAPSEDADRAVRYLTKYLAKSISTAYANPADADPDYQAHVDRLHAELRLLPCSPTCANWLRYGIQPKNPGPGLRAGDCASKAHDREHLGLGGRRVLVSRQWSGKTLKQHKADRATVVREALLTSGIIAPETERFAATVTMSDGSPRFIWTDTRPDPITYARVIMETVLQHSAWRAQYETAKTVLAAAGAVNTVSATRTDPDG